MDNQDPVQSNYLRPKTRGKFKIRTLQGSMTWLIGSFKIRRLLSAGAASIVVPSVAFCIMGLISTIAQFFYADLSRQDQIYVSYGFLSLLMVLTVSVLLTAWNSRAAAIAEGSIGFKYGRNAIKFYLANLLTAAIGCIGPLLLTAAVILYFNADRWHGTDWFVMTLYYLMYPSFFIGYAPFALVPIIVAQEGCSPISALRRSLQLTAGNRIVIGICLMFSHLVALLSYALAVVPGLLMFDWNPGILLNLYLRLKEEESPTPALQTDAVQPTTTQTSVSA